MSAADKTCYRCRVKRPLTDFIQQKNGRLYDGDSLDETWPRQRKMIAPYGLTATPVTAAGMKP